MKNVTKLYILLFVCSVIFAFSLPAKAAFNNNYYQSCNYHAYRDCVGNSIYWYDSCGSQQDLYQNCAGLNQVCQYGQCVVKQAIYTAHYRTACQDNNLYWYDSLGSLNSLYKNCVDTNSCTPDTCSLGKCSNIVKCDGTTCAIGSADYSSHCVAEANINANAVALTLSFLGKKNVTAQQWNKTIEVGPDLTTYFLVNVINNSNAEVDGVNLSVNIPNEISSIGNLKVNDIPVVGDIITGIDIGSIGAGSSKTITFEGRTQGINTAGSKQAIATVRTNGVTQADSFTLNMIAGQVAAVSKTSSSSWFVEFLKRWYLWFLVALVLIFLFIVVFRRVSSN